jgi:hypothetical protein
MSDYVTHNYACEHCSKSQDITFRLGDFIGWSDGSKYIQDALGYLTLDERELMLRKTCGKCFDSFYPPLDNG